MSETEHPALEVLYAFFAEQDAWEMDCAERYKRRELRTDEQWDEQREKLANIFERYCEVGRNAERLKDKGSFSPDVPEHHNEKVILVQDKNGKIRIQTLAPSLGGREFLYEMVQKNGKYLLRDIRKYRYPGKDRWSPHML